MAKTSKTIKNKPRLTKAQLSKEIEVKLSAFVDSSIESFVLLDENLNYMFLNPTAERMIGVSREAVVGKNILDIAPNIKESGRYDKYLNVLRTGEPFSVEDAVSHTKFGAIELSLKAFKVGNWLGVIATDITERKQADDALRDSEERYRTLFENMLEGFAYCKMSFDDHGRPVDWVYLAVNRAFEQLTALKNIVGKRVTEAIPGIKGSNPELFEIYGRVALTGRSERFVIEIKSLSMWLNISVFSPAKEYFVAVFENITERKKVEEALKESEEKWRSLSENSPDYIALLDLDATVLYVNRTVPDLTKEDIIGASALKYVPPEFHQTWSDCFKRVAASGKPDMITAVYHTKEGGTQYLEVRIGPVFKNGQVVAFISSSTDITERKKAEEALRQSEEYFHSLTDNAVDVILVIGADGVRKYVSPSIERVRGYKPEELIGKEAIEGVHPDDVPKIADIFVQLTENPGKLLQWECRLRHKDGTWRIVEGISRNFFDNPVVAGIVSNYRDITERKKMEEQERRHSHDLDLLSKTAMSLIELPYDADIHHFIAERLQELAEGSAVLVNSFDEVSDTFCVREALGVGEQLEALTRILGFNLIGIPTPISDEARQGLSLNELVKVQGGIYDLASGAIPMPICQEIEKLLAVVSVYAIGLHWEGRLYGSAVILTRDRTELRNKDVIETFVRQASIALQRRHAEEALEESERKYRALIEAAGKGGEGIIIIQDSGEREAAFVFVNDEFCKMCGYSREELLTRSAWDLVPSEVAVLLKDWYKRRHMGEALPGHYEAAGIRKDGTVVPLDLSVVTMPCQGKIATVLYMRDITERKRMEEALRKSEQTIRQLAKASAYAHEEERQRVSLEVHDRISQTLTAAFHQLQALGAIPIENTGAQQILKRASDLLQESIRESRNIIEDLYSPVLSDFGIVAVIDEELRRFEEETGCRTKFDKRFAVRPTPDVELTAYRIFREILANIKRHAIGATKVEVSLSCEAGAVSLQVKDNGPGFDVEAALQNGRMGGLQGMQRRADLGGGTCEVISGRGQGTTVTVRLPYSSESPATGVGKDKRRPE